MWWPNRDINITPLHQNELDIDHEVIPDGVAVWGAIPGQRCDSTRAEIVAATAMLAAPVPCHIGIDNLNTVRFASCLIQDINHMTKKPYGLIPNGDVLQEFHRHLRAKLAVSVKVSKVKGHATTDDVIEGRTTLSNKIGNDMSDRYATKGIKSHCPDAVQFSHKCGMREKMRILVQRDINLFLLDMLEANRVVVAKENRISKIIGGTTTESVFTEKGPTKHTVRVPTQLEYFNVTDGLSTFTVTQPLFCMLGDFKRPLVHVVSFLQLLEFKPVTHGIQGISWLELFIIFELWGGIASDTRPNSANLSIARASLKVELANFKRLIKHATSLFLPPDQAMLFKPSKVSTFRLGPAGFLSFVPCVRFNVHIDRVDATQLMQAVLSMRMQLTYKKKQRLAAGTLSVGCRKVRYGAMPAWRKFLSPQQLITERQGAIFYQAQELEQQAPSTCEHLFLKCSKCDFTKNFINHTLYNTPKARWNVLWCAFCRKTYTARSWLCPCGLQWFTCNIHRAHGFICKTVPPSVSPVDLVAGLAPLDVLPEPARKKRRPGLGEDLVLGMRSTTLEKVQLQPPSSLFSEGGEPSSSATGTPLSSLFSTSVVFKRYQDRAAKRALESAVPEPNEQDNIARQLAISSKRRRKMDKRSAAGQLLPALNHPAARLRFPHLPAQGGRMSERGTITPHSTFPLASASSRSNPYAFLPQAPQGESGNFFQIQAPNDG